MKNLFSGRFCRNEFVKYYSLIILILFSVYFILYFSLSSLNWIGVRLYGFAILLNLLVTPIRVKRIHDLGLSGWFSLLFLIIPFRFVFDLLLCFWPGNKKDNKYGKVKKLNRTDDKEYARWFIFILAFIFIFYLFKNIICYPSWSIIPDFLYEVKEVNISNSCMNLIDEKKQIVDNYISCTESFSITGDMNEIDSTAITGWIGGCIKNFTVDFGKIYGYPDTCKSIEKEILSGFDSLPQNFLYCQMQGYKGFDTDEEMEQYIRNSIDCNSQLIDDYNNISNILQDLKNFNSRRKISIIDFLPVSFHRLIK